LFDFDQRLRETHGIVASESQELTAEQKQRDIFEAHRHRVFSVSYYMTANEIEAENILTETFVDAFQATPEPSSHGIDQALMQRLERRFSLEPTPAAQPMASAGLHRGQTRRTDLEEAVGALPPRERLIFLLRDVESYTAVKIGALLNMDETEVQCTLFSARVRLRNALSDLRARGNAAGRHSCEVERDPSSRNAWS
jgi:DNA-directed RNA polymerase specialized sigma24 family protein